MSYNQSHCDKGYDLHVHDLIIPLIEGEKWKMLISFSFFGKEYVPEKIKSLEVFVGGEKDKKKILNVCVRKCIVRINRKKIFVVEFPVHLRVNKVNATIMVELESGRIVYGFLENYVLPQVRLLSSSSMNVINFQL